MSTPGDNAGEGSSRGRFAFADADQPSSAQPNGIDQSSTSRTPHPHSDLEELDDQVELPPMPERSLYSQFPTSSSSSATAAVAPSQPTPPDPAPPASLSADSSTTHTMPADPPVDPTFEQQSSSAGQTRSPPPPPPPPADPEASRPWVDRLGLRGLSEMMMAFAGPPEGSADLQESSTNDSLGAQSTQSASGTQTSTVTGDGSQRSQTDGNTGNHGGSGSATIDSSGPTAHPHERSAQQESADQPLRPGRAFLQSDGLTPSSPADGSTQHQSEMSGSTSIFYNLPFNGPDGRQAVLAIPGAALPIIQIPEDDAPRGSPQLDASGRRRVRATVLAPTSPLFVPIGASFLPFSFLWDASGWAWPILPLGQASDATIPSEWRSLLEHPRRPHFFAGRPFPLSMEQYMHMSGAGQQMQEQPSPEKARKFVDSLEIADAELRTRMARLGIGEVGAFGTEDETGGTLGCPVCLETYDETSDRPEWIGGSDAKASQVVVVPCNGFHAMHRHCLEEWLSVKPASRWSCPMCRAKISPSELVSQAGPNASTPRSSGRSSATTTSTPRPSARNANPTAAASTPAPPPSSLNLEKALAARSRSLRDEIHRREVDQGYTCDYPACFPDYTEVHSHGGGGGGTARRSEGSGGTERSGNEEDMGVELDRQVIKLQPCGHRLHLECLTTALRVKDDLKSPVDERGDEVRDEDDDEDEDEGEDQEDNEGVDEGRVKGRIRYVGKWVECPLDRRECWAEIPVAVIRRRRRTRGPANGVSTSSTAVSIGEKDGLASGEVEVQVEVGQPEAEDGEAGRSRVHSLSTSAEMPYAKRNR